MKIFFLFHLKNSFRAQHVQVFVVFSRPLHKWNNLCHELACILLLHHQTLSDNI